MTARKGAEDRAFELLPFMAAGDCAELTPLGPPERIGEESGVDGDTPSTPPKVWTPVTRCIGAVGAASAGEDAGELVAAAGVVVWLVVVLEYDVGSACGCELFFLFVIMPAATPAPAPTPAAATPPSSVAVPLSSFCGCAAPGAQEGPPGFAAAAPSGFAAAAPSGCGWTWVA